MIKKIRAWGGSKAVLFSSEECDLWNLKEGDVVYLTIQKDIDWKVMKERVQVQDLKDMGIDIGGKK